MEINHDENGISLLDLLITVAENIKLLILGPLLVGLLALGFGFTLPQSFISQAILSLPAVSPTSSPGPGVGSIPTATQAAAMLVSPLVLDPVIVSMNLADGRSIAGARQQLASQIKAVVGKDGLLRVDVTAPQPLQAQAISNAVINTWLKSTAPGARDRADLEKRLSQAMTSLASVNRLLDRLATDGATLLNKPLTLGDATTSIVAMGELQARYITDVINIPRSLQGLSRDVVVQPPTLPTESVASKKSLIATLAALGSGFALLLWVFMRQAWRGAVRDPQTAEKLAKLRVALGFKG
jgi:uncharacterized protein involved in exopolysaccharide biosynthesis